MTQEIQEFVNKLNALNTAHYDKKGYTFPRKEFSFTLGGKYAKIIRDDGVYCFVALTEGSTKAIGSVKPGDVLYPAGWAGPAKGVRGHISDPDISVFTGPYGVRYNDGTPHYKW